MEIEKAQVSVLDHGFLYSDGFYDTMKAYNGKILDIESHIARIERSLKTVKIKLPRSMETVREWVEKVAKMNSMKLARVRLTITRGVNDFDFNSSKNPTLVITAEPIEIDNKIYKGVPVITVNAHRTMPEIKVMGVTAMILGRGMLTAKKAFEALFVSEAGFVREGTVANFFWVKNGKIYTPKNKILKGITRKEVLELCRKEGFEVIEKDVKKAELMKADEVFLSNTKFGIVPVLSVDGRKIGPGVVGPTAKKVMKAFEAFVEGYLAA